MNRLFTKQLLVSLLLLAILPISSQAAVTIDGTKVTVTGLISPVSYTTGRHSEYISRGTRTCTRYLDGSSHPWESVSGGSSSTQFPVIQNTSYLASNGLSEIYTRQDGYTALVYYTNQNECGRSCAGSQYVVKTGTRDAYATVYSSRPVAGLRSYFYKNVVSQNMSLQFSGAEVIIDGGTYSGSPLPVKEVYPC